jgi:sterol-4alpha-carboxylate 3-dehydrogenase (decarboxylating)
MLLLLLYTLDRMLLLLILQDVDRAVSGVDVVVHVATATPTSENALNKQLMDDVNVKGTQHVVAACKKYGVHNLVYTSSASGG